MENLKTVNQLNNDSGGKKLQLVKDALAESKSSYLSDYDLIQRILI